MTEIQATNPAAVIVLRILDGRLMGGEEVTLGYVRRHTGADVGQANAAITQLVDLGYLERMRTRGGATVVALVPTDLKELVDFCCALQVRAATLLVRTTKNLPDFPETPANILSDSAGMPARLAYALTVMHDYHCSLVKAASDKLGIAFRIFAVQLQVCLAQLGRSLDPEVLAQYGVLVRDAIAARDLDMAVGYLGVYYAMVMGLADPLLGGLDPADVIDTTLEATAATDGDHGCTGKLSVPPNELRRFPLPGLVSRLAARYSRRASLACDYYY